ncbi:MAG: choice-of-anchor J domain-containing protein [Bacteroidales bacterium]|nr:choice-of-anchor J domain-containing protein [Bacteroidales bacterium]
MKRKTLLFLMLTAMFSPLASNAQAVLLSENFDNMTWGFNDSYSADDWFAYNAGNGTNNWSLNTQYSNYAYSGPNSAVYLYSSTYSANCYLVSAPFSVNAYTTELSVSLWERVRNSSYAETFSVFFVKASDVPAAADVASATRYNAIASASYTNTNFVERSGSVTNAELAGQSVRVVVHCTSPANKYALYIDDITVTETITTGPYIVLEPATATISYGFTQTLTATYENVSGEPTITYSSSNTSVATVSGSGTTATVTGVAPGTATITAIMIIDESDYTATCTITVTEPSYCTPYYSNSDANYIYIAGFSTEDGETNISNTGTSLSSGGYFDYFNSHSASAEAGQTIGFTVTPGSLVPTMKYGMWIDWNQDYDFNDAGENVAIQNSGIQTNWTGIISIPITTPPGSYRVRIEGMYSGDVDLNPCVNGHNGEAEDYQLIVLPASSCPKPSNVQLSASDDIVTVTWSGYSSSYNININGTVTNNVTSPYVFTGELSTTYTIMLQANCEGNETSDWSTPKSITIDCLEEDKCSVSVTLTDYWGEAAGYMYVADANTNTILAEITLNNNSETIHINVCDGTELDFYYYAQDYYAYQNGYIITDPTGEVIAEHEGCEDPYECSAPTDGVVASYTVNCPHDCITPSALQAVVTTGSTVQLRWSSNQESYNVNYRKVLFYEDFENGLPDTWTTIDNNGDGYNWYVDNDTEQVHGGTHMAASASYVFDSGDHILSPDNWLITPQVELKGTMGVWLRSVLSWEPDHFAIYVSTTGNSVEDFNTILVAETSAGGEYTEYTADLSSYNGQEGYIAIRHFNSEGKMRLVLDDFRIYDNEIQNATATSGSLTLNNLDSNSSYEWQVQGINQDCDGGTTEWSECAYFTTPMEYTLYIPGYEDYDDPNGGYFLIASPVTVNPADVIDTYNQQRMIDGDFDLYYFDQSQDLEWINYKGTDGNFNLEPGKGYLYAHDTFGMFNLSGTPYNGNGVIELDYDSNATDFAGWNLLGNPYDYNVSVDNAFYIMNEEGTEIIPADENTPIMPMQGFFVVATEAGQKVTFSEWHAPFVPLDKLVMNLTNKRGATIDRAIVRFDGGHQLPKFQLNKHHTKVFFPQEGTDYAIVNATEMGEMPVSFKAEKNGNYTLSFAAQEVSFDYLHLIDNLTGNDVDLLSNPSYSFEANTTDYASRFKIVFATGSSAGSDTFAFYSNGELVINNEGNATLQVVDVMGRILKNESINGCANISVNAAPDVYMIRLVNGNNTKTQKIVVK